VAGRSACLARPCPEFNLQYCQEKERKKEGKKKRNKEKERNVPSLLSRHLPL
jgi:hypothetical protein